MKLKDVLALNIGAIEAAWGIIANAHNGDWSKATPEWRDAAEQWRDRYVTPPRPWPMGPGPWED